MTNTSILFLGNNTNTEHQYNYMSQLTMIGYSLLGIAVACVCAVCFMHFGGCRCNREMGFEEDNREPLVKPNESCRGVLKKTGKTLLEGPLLNC